MDTTKRPNGSFVADVSKLAGGTVSGVLIGILIAPFLTRLFTPEVFGVVEVFTSMLAIITVVVCLRYEFAIMLPEDDRDGAALLAGSVGFVIICSGLTAGAIFFFGDSIAELFGSENLKQVLWMLPLAVFASGFYQAIRFWSTRNQRYAELSCARIALSISHWGLKLLVGLAGYVTALTMIGANILGYTFAAAILLYVSVRSDWIVFKQMRPDRVAKLLRRHYKFPMVGLWANLLNTLTMQMPGVILAVYFNKASVGYYSLSKQLVTLPMTLIGTSIAQVFFQRVSLANLQGDLSFVVEKVFLVLLKSMLYPFLALAVVAPELFGIVFGSEWREAGVYVQILSVWQLCILLAAPLNTLFNVLERQGAGLIFNAIFFVLMIAALYIGGIIGDIRIALALYAIGGTVLYLILIIWLLKAAGILVGSVLSKSFKIILCAFIEVSVLIALKYIVDLGAISLLLCAFIGGMVYCLVLFKSDKLIAEWVRDKLSDVLR